SASDDNELDTVNVQLIDSNGTAVDSQSTAVSGTSAQDKNTQLSDSGGYEDEYTIKIIVTDSAGQEDTDTVTDTAEGTDP
ncbi:MAG: hypothetical protein V5A21_04150, partial [Halapricum sp.]